MSNFPCPPDCDDDDDIDDVTTAWLKFSGGIYPEFGSPRYLCDSAFEAAADTPPAYPAPSRGKLKDLTVNAHTGTLPEGASITVRLLKNGSPVSGFEVVYSEGEAAGIRRTKTHAVKFSSEDTFDLEVLFNGIADPFLMSAVIGFRPRS